MKARRILAGKFIWFEHVSNDAKKAQPFYAEVLGWKTVPFPMEGGTYEMVYAGDAMVGGYTTPDGEHTHAHWRSAVSVADVDAAVEAAKAKGGRVLKAPFDGPGAGRIARIADPQGAVIVLFAKLDDDPADGPNVPGRFFWNELHTPDPVSAVGFYEAVVGYTHRSLDMGPAGSYHLLAHGGVDRAGVTHHLPEGARPHWLPYVAVEDADRTIDRARANGATIRVSPHDIPGVGRFGVFEDPTGALLAVMKPVPPSA
jgi:predicted enzyme related to lactoylglutathione lyase